MRERTVRKNYKFDQAAVMAVENRDKNLYPVEADFVRDAVKHFAAIQKMESIDKRIDFLYQHLGLDTGGTEEDVAPAGEAYEAGDLDLRF